MKKPISILKASGLSEPWSPQKLEHSLRAVKAPDHLIREIVTHVEKDLRDGMRTSDIYKHAFALLKRYDSPFAAEYSLKKAIMQLGPSGYPFEKFVAQILSAQGYQTRVGVMVRGKCVTHEVDVIAEKEDERILVEAKFHNSPDIKSDVKVALYVRARFLDIQERFDGEGMSNERYTQAWLITNTNFTSQATQYGACAGLAMTGWNYPRGHTLQDLIRNTQTHPVTCLTTLTEQQKLQLITNGTVLCRGVIDDPTRLEQIGVTKSRIEAVLKEGSMLCPIL